MAIETATSVEVQTLTTIDQVASAILQQESQLLDRIEATPDDISFEDASRFSAELETIRMRDVFITNAAVIENIAPGSSHIQKQKDKALPFMLDIVRTAEFDLPKIMVDGDFDGETQIEVAQRQIAERSVEMLVEDTVPSERVKGIVAQIREELATGEIPITVRAEVQQQDLTEIYNVSDGPVITPEQISMRGLVKIFRIVRSLSTKTYDVVKTALIPV